MDVLNLIKCAREKALLPENRSGHNDASRRDQKSLFQDAKMIGRLTLTGNRLCRAQQHRTRSHGDLHKKVGLAALEKRTGFHAGLAHLVSDLNLQLWTQGAHHLQSLRIGNHVLLPGMLESQEITQPKTKVAREISLPHQRIELVEHPLKRSVARGCVLHHVRELGDGERGEDIDDNRCEDLELLVAEKSDLDIAREDELHDSNVHCVCTRDIHGVEVYPSLGIIIEIGVCLVRPRTHQEVNQD